MYDPMNIKPIDLYADVIAHHSNYVKKHGSPEDIDFFKKTFFNLGLREYVRFVLHSLCHFCNEPELRHHFGSVGS